MAGSAKNAVIRHSQQLHLTTEKRTAQAGHPARRDALETLKKAA